MNNKKFIVSLICMILLFILTFSFTYGNSQSEEGIFAGKFGKAQIFDVQRSPSYPNANEAFTLSSFSNIYDSKESSQFDNNDWGTNGDRYVQL